MKREILRIGTELGTNGYALTSFEDLGLELDPDVTSRLCEVAIRGKFGAEAAKTTERLEERGRKGVKMVQDEEARKLGKLVIEPVINCLFDGMPGVVPAWHASPLAEQVYAINCYETDGMLPAHQDNLGHPATVLAVTVSGVRNADLYRSGTEFETFGKPERSFRVTAGSILLMDQIADPGHGIKCIEGPSVAVITDVPGLLRPTMIEAQN